MSSFEETIARMKGLYTYGNDTNESKNINEHTLEHHAIGADGKSYGIIKEQNKYYIKTTSKKNELIPESYEYIGGFCNRKDYEYPSYNKALKNFELKLASINEACDGNVNIETLDPFKREDVIVEGTDKMKNELARVRQIMHNASMIMNESNGYTTTPVTGNGVKTGTPNNGDMKQAGKAPENPSANIKGNKPGEDTFTEDPKTPDMMKEESSYANGEPRQNTRYWDSDESTDGNPDIDWVEGSERVNEETEEWDEGLPSSAGVGEADTDHNNDPFNNSLNEEEDFDDEEDDEFGDDFGEPEDKSTDTDFDDGLEPYGDDEEEPDGDEFDNEEEPEGDEDEFELELGDDEPEDDEFDDEEEPEDDEFDDESGDDELGDEEGFEFELGDDEPENEFEDEYDDEPEDEFGDEFDDEYGDENGNMDECGFSEDCLYESKNRRMNRIVESVIRRMLKEDELHDFGKHPGYRKKPMTLPPTGQDKNQWGEDWNDESVYSEEPFGKQIGDGDPFNNMVDNVTRDVLYQLSHGVPINKKKAD